MRGDDSMGKNERFDRAHGVSRLLGLVGDGGRRPTPRFVRRWFRRRPIRRSVAHPRLAIFDSGALVDAFPGQPGQRGQHKREPGRVAHPHPNSGKYRR